MKRSTLFLLPLMALILVACAGKEINTTTPEPSQSSNFTADESNPLERTDKQGAVTVVVTPINMSNPGETLDFEVSMQTHSVELDMDLVSLSSLKTDTGILVNAVSWDGTSGGHHVSGKLSFPASKEEKTILPDAKSLTLTVQMVDAPERIFTWILTE